MGASRLKIQHVVPVHQAADGAGAHKQGVSKNHSLLAPVSNTRERETVLMTPTHDGVAVVGKGGRSSCEVQTRPHRQVVHGWR